jgi:hypothetical protein
MNRRRTRRRITLFGILLAAITIAMMVLTLVGIAPPFPALEGFSAFSEGLVQLMTVVGAIAVIIGVLNLLSVHTGKLISFSSAASLYSAVTVVTFAIVLIVHVLELRGTLRVENSNVTLTLMDTLQVVIESALAGLLFFFLVYSGYRLMRRRVTVWAVIFIASLLIVLLGYALPTSPLAVIREWLLRVPVSAGTRGLLIGIAIGTVAVGVRVLLGQDRLFRE